MLTRKDFPFSSRALSSVVVGPEKVVTPDITGGKHLNLMHIQNLGDNSLTLTVQGYDAVNGWATIATWTVPARTAQAQSFSLSGAQNQWRINGVGLADGWITAVDMVGGSL